MRSAHERSNQSNETPQRSRLVKTGKFLTKASAFALPIIPAAAVTVAEAPSANATEVASTSSISNHYLEALQHGHPTVDVDLQAQYGKGTKIYRSPTTNGGKKNVMLTVGKGQDFSTQGVVAYNGWQPVSYANTIVYVQFHNSNIVKDDFTAAQERTDSHENSTISIQGSEIIANHTLPSSMPGEVYRSHTPTSTGGLYELSN